MARFVYRQDESGRTVAVQVAEKPPHRGTPTTASMGFHDIMLNGYKMAEERGDRWTSPYSKNLTKRIHENARHCE